MAKDCEIQDIKARVLFLCKVSSNICSSRMVYQISVLYAVWAILGGGPNAVRKRFGLNRVKEMSGQNAQFFLTFLKDCFAVLFHIHPGITTSFM